MSVLVAGIVLSKVRSCHIVHRPNVNQMLRGQLASRDGEIWVKTEVLMGNGQLVPAAGNWLHSKLNSTSGANEDCSLPTSQRYHCMVHPHLAIHMSAIKIYRPFGVNQPAASKYKAIRSRWSQLCDAFTKGDKTPCFSFSPPGGVLMSNKPQDSRPYAMEIIPP